MSVINVNICFSTVIKPTFLDNVICSKSLNITNFFINLYGTEINLEDHSVTDH